MIQFSLSQLSLPRSFRAATLALACLAAPGFLAPVWAGDVTLDETVLKTGENSRITFKSVVLSDCDLTQAEAASLFSGALSREEAGALLERMTARELEESGSRHSHREGRPFRAA